jgi:hypothetical protein
MRCDTISKTEKITATVVIYPDSMVILASNPNCDESSVPDVAWIRLKNCKIGEFFKRIFDTLEEGDGV